MGGGGGGGGLPHGDDLRNFYIGVEIAVLVTLRVSRVCYLESTF